MGENRPVFAPEISLFSPTNHLSRSPASPTRKIAAWSGSIGRNTAEIFLGFYQKPDNNFLGEHPTPTVPTGVLELQKLIAKFGELQKVITDTGALLAKERLDLNADLEAARKEIREIKAQKSTLISQGNNMRQKLARLDRLAELAIAHLNLEKETALRVIDNLKIQITSESERAYRAETEVQSLKDQVRDNREENSQLSAVVDNLKIQITSESERAYRAETEVQSLKDQVRDNREENSQLSAVVDNLKIQITSESGRAHEAEAEVQSLKDALSNLNSEKEYSLYQYQQSQEMISYLQTRIRQAEEYIFLEKSSSVVKLETGGLRRKLLKDIEDSVQALYDQKVNLIVERTALISQVNSMRQKLTRVENIHAELEIRHWNLKKENALRAHIIPLFSRQVDSMSLKLARVENRHAVLEINHLNLEKENEEKLDHLEGENRGLRAYLDAYLPLITSLQGTIVSIEEQTLSLVRHPASFNQESEEIFLGSYQKSDNNFLGEHPTPMVPTGVLELQKLKAKFGELQKVITDTAALLAKERLDLNADLEAARKEIREIEAQKSTLISQGNNMRQKLARLEDKHAELVIDHLNLEKEYALRLQVIPLLAEKVRDSQEENSQLLAVIDNVKIQITSESERAYRAETKVQSLKDQVRDNREENSQLSAVIDNLNIQITSESGRAHEAETEVQSLKDALSNLNSEKEYSLYQYQQSLEMISYLLTQIRQAEESTFLEKSSSVVKLETEGLRRKLLKDIEDSIQALYDQKANLTVERTVLISQVNSMRQKLTRLEDRHAELLIDHLNLEKESALRVPVIPLLGEKVRDSQEENPQLLAVIDNLKIQITSESERAYRAETEVQSLKDQVRDTAALLAKERLDHNADLEAARKEIRETKAQRSSSLEEIRTENHKLKHDCEDSKRKHVTMMEDIRLDQVSSTPYGLNRFQITRKGEACANDGRCSV